MRRKGITKAMKRQVLKLAAKYRKRGIKHPLAKAWREVKAGHSISHRVSMHLDADIDARDIQNFIAAYESHR